MTVAQLLNRLHMVNQGECRNVFLANPNGSGFDYDVEFVEITACGNVVLRPKLPKGRE
jgi:hypothetical protein